MQSSQNGLFYTKSLTLYDGMGRFLPQESQIFHVGD